MDKYQNRYRIASSRAAWWDYGRNAAYFVTICTKDRISFFGDINRGKMQLSDVGEIAYIRWQRIPKQFPFVELGEFVVMPNHIHGIIIIDKTDCNDSTSTHDAVNVETRLIGSLHSDPSNQSDQSGGITGIRNPMFHTNLSRIIRWYKGSVTYESRKINPVFGWQFRFHDHIIRNTETIDRISTYIVNNPGKWNHDKLNSDDT